MRNALAHAGKSVRRVVSAFIATAFAQDDAEAATARWPPAANTGGSVAASDTAIVNANVLDPILGSKRFRVGS